MSNSADVPHPGMSVWVFVALAKIFKATDPIGVNLACMIVNATSLIGLLVFVACAVPREEREPWWWATALVAVNPLAIVFHRKIWPPSLLPAVTIMLLWTWWYRDRKACAFAFGIVGAVASQIRPGAMFFVAGLMAWDFVFARHSIRWRWWIAGVILGGLTALPWLHHLLFVAERSASDKIHWWRPFEFKFWTYWLTEPFGFSLAYSLGDDFAEFLQWPIANGRPTYVVATLHAVMAFVLIAVIGRRTWQVLRSREWNVNGSRTKYLIGAVALGYGLILTATALPVYRHYLIITFPLMFVWLALCTIHAYSRSTARRILVTCCVAQCLVSIAFLHYVHVQDRSIRGDYGMPYAAQLRQREVATQSE